MSEPTQDATIPTVSPSGFAPGEPVSQHERPERSEWNPMSAPATYSLLAINIAVYLWMILHGVSVNNPPIDSLIHYGANSSIYVLYAHQWYRLLTATFVHIGIIHIATNMWCLWNLGLLGEPLLGPWGLTAVYVLTGVAGNLLSMAWDVFSAIATRHHLMFGVGAGASGAVFGIAGILIILLSNRRLPIPWEELKRLRTSVVRFAVINLVIGLGTIFAGPVRIDNSAHLGGFVCGLALGPALLPRMTAGRVRYLRRQKLTFAAAAFLLSLFGYWVSSFVQTR
jgi:rhomboid protease GluP